MDEKSAKDAVNQITQLFSKMVESMNAITNDLVTLKEIIDQLDESMLDDPPAAGSQKSKKNWTDLGYTKDGANVSYLDYYFEGDDIEEAYEKFLEEQITITSDDDVDLSVASLKLPGMQDIAPKCPKPLVGVSKELQDMCNKPDMPLRTRIMHLNDDHGMSRQDIAALLQSWHDAGKIDIAFKCDEGHTADKPILVPEDDNW